MPPAPTSSRHRVRPALAAGAALLVLAAAGAGGWGGHALRHGQDPLPPRALPAGAATPAAVAAATAVPGRASSPAPGPSATAAGAATPGALSPAGVAAALAGPLADPRLGDRVDGRVVDVATGQALFERGPDVTATPASTTKITTAAAVLTVRAATDRLTTEVVAGPTPDSVVLVGGGDPTLTAAAPGRAPAYPDAARLTDLAAAVRAARGGVPVATVYVDTGLFTGPATGPGWDPTDAPSEYASPITALMVDGGRDTPDATVRSADPAGAAGRALAADLGAAATATGTAPAGAAVLGTVASAPLGELVDQMLQRTDNVLAEVLARQVALARGLPAGFDGAVRAVRVVLPQAGDGLVDASGLSRLDRLSARQLTETLRHVAGTDRLHAVVDDLPVAGWNGTLADRYATPPAAAGAGRVRAKTGTLTGVSSLAGVAVTAGGRLLAFALLADRIPGGYADTLAAEPALDVAAATLAGCGCGG